MKAVMLMFDTLRRDQLPPYNSDAFPLPNFERLAKKTVRFDNFYVGSSKRWIFNFHILDTDNAD